MRAPLPWERPLRHHGWRNFATLQDGSTYITGLARRQLLYLSQQAALQDRVYTADRLRRAANRMTKPQELKWGWLSEAAGLEVAYPKGRKP